MTLPSKKLIPALFLTLAIIATPLIVNQLNRTNLDTRKKATDEESLIWKEDFNQALSDQWQIKGSYENFKIVSLPSIQISSLNQDNSDNSSDEKVLAISSTGETLQAVTHKIPASDGIFKISFYEKGNESTGSIFSINNENNENYLMIFSQEKDPTHTMPTGLICDFDNNIIKWNPVSQANNYAIRIDADSPSWDPETCATTPQVDNQDVCQNNISQNFFHYTFDPNKNYGVWLHSLTDQEGWSIPSSISCDAFSSINSDPTYFYRVDNKNYDSKIPRTPGWHTFEFVVTPQGTYGKIDGQPLSEIALDLNLKKITAVNLGRSWNSPGISYFDNFIITSLFQLPTNPQTALDNWSDKVYFLYKDFHYDNLIEEFQQKQNADSGIARTLGGQALMHAYYYTRDNKEEDLQKAQKALKTVVDLYPYYQKRWLSQITSNQILFSAWWLWDFLDPTLQKDIYQLAIQEADFWSYVLQEAQNKPWQKTLPTSIRTRDCYNVEVITSTSNSDNTKGDPLRHLDDTKAEENSSVAQLLASVHNMFPSHPHAEEWNNAAKCFALHTFNTGEEKCDIKGKTLDQDYTLYNHDFGPNFSYVFGGITGLQQGAFSYRLANRSVPTEFVHNIENKTESQIWTKNVKIQYEDGDFMASCDPMTTNKDKCLGEQSVEWAKTDLKNLSFILPYWIKLDNDQKAKQLFSQNLNYQYLLKKNYVNKLYPFNQPILQSNNFDPLWWKNIERYAQVSAKYYVLDNFEKQSFRNKFFPQNLLPSCSVEMTDFQNKKIKFSIQGKIDPESKFRVWLETDNRGQIPLPQEIERVYNNKTFYLLKQVNNSQETEITLPELPNGNYYLHCDIQTTQNNCSGNPFCQHEGGQEECAGWVSCSDQDHLAFTIANTPQPTATPTSIWINPTPSTAPPTATPQPTATPTSGVQTAKCHDQYFGQWWCETRAPAKYPNVEATCKLNPALGKINSNSPASAINFWKWSYCEEGQVITPTPIPDNGWNCQGQYWGYAQCYWRDNHYLLIRQGQADCRLNPNKETNPNNLLDPINYWKWTYCAPQ